MRRSSWVGIGLCILSAPWVCGAELLVHSTKPLQAEAKMEFLDSWETPIAGFFVRSHHSVPSAAVDASMRRQWVLRIEGLTASEKPLTLSLRDLEAMPQVSFHAVLECSGNRRAKQTPSVPGVQWERGAVGNAEWTGVRLSDILKKVGRHSSARFLTVEGADQPSLPSVPGFKRSIALEKLGPWVAGKIEPILALKMNRVPIPSLHGGPIRLVIPGFYGENWIKWLTRIEFTAHEDPGFYMKKAYRVPKEPVAPGQPWDSTTGNTIEELPVQALITHPVDGQMHPAGLLRVRGQAFAGQRTIQRVEISKDEGRTWQDAHLQPPDLRGGWQSFEFELPFLNPGAASVLVRATDSQGTQQPMHSEWNPGGYVKNEVDRVQFQVLNNSSHNPSRSRGGQANNEKDQFLKPSLFNQSEGAQLMQQRCTKCHSLALVESQRLSQAQWQAVLKKMQTFGATISDAESDVLLKYFLGAATVPRAVPVATAYSRLAPEPHSKIRVNVKNGERLYKQYCAVCHGAQGQGAIGPRLKGKWISDVDFWAAIRDGQTRGNALVMPSFAALITQSQIFDVQAYLR